MLELDRVSKFYSANGVVTAGFSKISLNFDIGEFVAITGESGSGKSTLLNVISRLDSYEEGEMYIFGQPTSGYDGDDLERYRKRYIGNIFQTFNLINNYTVYQNVELVLLLAGYSRKEVRPKVEDIIRKVGLEKYSKTKASKLSGGQKQRVAIARALAKETPIIVADEPTGNLDVASAAEIIKLLASLSKDKLIVIVTHNYEQVEKYINRKITMHDGRVVEDKQLVPQLLVDAEGNIRENTASEAIVPAFVSTPQEAAPEAPSPADIQAEMPKEIPARKPITIESDGTELSANDFLTQLTQKAEAAQLKAAEEEAALLAREQAAQDAVNTVKPESPEPQQTPEPTPEVQETQAPQEEPKEKTSSRKRKTETAPENFREARNGKLSAGSTLRLGVRNTFSLPAKFLLLLFIFLFLVTSTFVEYTSFKSNTSRSGGLSYSPVFNDASRDRLVVTKEGHTEITQSDVSTLEGLPNVKLVDTKDIMRDASFTMTDVYYDQNAEYDENNWPEYWTSVIIGSMSDMDGREVIAGRLPEEGTNEALMLFDRSDSWIQDEADALLDKNGYLQYDNGSAIAGNMSSEVRIVGYAYYTEEESTAAWTSNVYSEAKLVVSDSYREELITLCLARLTTLEATMNRTISVVGNSDNSVAVLMASENVPRGSIYLPVDLSYNWDYGYARGKTVTINAITPYGTTSYDYNVDAVYNEYNYKSITGFTGKYTEMAQGIYMNPEDILAMYDTTPHQASVIIEDEVYIDDTEQAIKDAGFKVLNVQKAAASSSNTFQMILNAMQTVVMVVALVVLFFISYFIIKLIFRSRNVYFSTVRMLGGTRGNCAWLLLVDLLVVFHIAFAIIMVPLTLLRMGILNLEALQMYITLPAALLDLPKYINNQDCVILYVVIFVMTILLALRYSSQMFKKTAMNAYKEEV